MPAKAHTHDDGRSAFRHRPHWDAAQFCDAREAEHFANARVHESRSRICGSAQEGSAMCDYSLHLIASRPAKVADRLVSTDFPASITRGFTEIGQPDVAVCLLPGTEIAFDDAVIYDRAFSMFGKARIEHRVARFRQVNMDDPHVHHDALEFPGGQIVMVTRLLPGQTATVLQLPAAAQDLRKAQTAENAAAPPLADPARHDRELIR
jgi:hypothetical protein